MACTGRRCEIWYETTGCASSARQYGSPSASDERSAGTARALSGSEGSVLDPIVAIRYRLTIEPWRSATVNIVSGISETRDTASALSKIQDRRLADGFSIWPGHMGR